MQPSRPRRISVKLPPQLPLKFYVIVLPIICSCVFLVVGLISRDIRLARERAAIKLAEMKAKLVAELPFMAYEPTYNWGQSSVSGTEWDAEVFLEAASCLNFSRTPASRKVHDKVLMHICRVKKLKTIDLRHTQVTDAWLPHLAKCDRLLLVSASGTKITTEGAKWLEAEKPGCLVFLVDPPPDVQGWAEANEPREMQRRAEGIRRY